MPIYKPWESTPIQIVAGEDVVFVAQVKDADGNPVNVAGWSFGCYFVEIGNPSNSISVTSGFTSGSSGVVMWPLSRSQTSGQAGKSLQGELWRTDSGLQKQLATGKLYVATTVRT